MNRLARRSILLASVTLLALPAVVQAQFILSTNNGQITIRGYTGSGGVVTIPSTTNGLPVSSIGIAAFFDCSRLTNVTIPNSVTSIGYGAFGFCSNLTSVTIPNSVTSIERWAFVGCSSLTGVYFKGNAPRLEDLEDNAVGWDDNVTIYYLPGTTGWSNFFGGRPTAIWKPATNAPTAGGAK